MNKETSIQQKYQVLIGCHYLLTKKEEVSNSFEQTYHFTSFEQHLKKLSIQLQSQSTRNWSRKGPRRYQSGEAKTTKSRWFHGVINDMTKKNKKKQGSLILPNPNHFTNLREIHYLREIMGNPSKLGNLRIPENLRRFFITTRTTHRAERSLLLPRRYTWRPPRITGSMAHGIVIFFDEKPMGRTTLA